MCLDIAYCDKMETATAKVRCYNAKHREGLCACFQEKYFKARAAINESVCEDSHAKHVKCSSFYFCLDNS